MRTAAIGDELYGNSTGLLMSKPFGTATDSSAAATQIFQTPSGR